MRVERPGWSADVPAGNGQRLLGYLALRSRTPHRRESLTDALWPQLEPERARRALSDTLYRLRSRLGDGWIQGNDALQLSADDLWVDMWEFDRLVATDDPERLARAVELCTGDLLPAVYDDWVEADRAARQAVLVAALGRIAVERETRGDLHEALATTRRQIVVEPLHEPGHQSYLRLLGRLGRFGEAATHFEELQRVLFDELGVAPLPETVTIMSRLSAEREAVSTLTPSVARFVGRLAERSLALDAVEAAMHGRGGVVGFEGPAGIGKSRLLEETIAGARWRGAQVLVGEAREVPEASPLAPLAMALAPLLAGPLRLHVEASLDPVAVAALGEIDARWGDETAAPAVHGQAEARLAYALRAFGTALAETGPLVLALDDMHWAGPALWHGLAALADGLTAGGGLLVLAYRRAGVEHTAGWEVLRDWDGRGMLRLATLQPFGFDEIAELAGRDADPGEVLAATGGLPFYVGRWLAGPDHAGSEAMIRERLALLPPASRRALDCAAVAGEHVAYRVWLDVSDLDAMTLAAVGEELTRQQWITPSGDGYSFVHDLVRTAVYESIPTGVRRSLHARAAEVLAVRDPPNTRARAYHLDHAGLAPEAAAMYTETAHHDIKALAFREAIDAYGRALELLPADRTDSRLEVALALAEACEAVGDRERQRPLLDDVVADARRKGGDATLLRALLVAGVAAGRTDSPARAEALLTEGLAVAARLGDRHSLALAAFQHADLMGQLGRWQEARDGVATALDHARHADDESLLGGVLRLSGIAARMTGDPAASVGWLLEAVDIHRRSGDRPEEVNNAANLLGAYYELGAWDELLTTADDALPVAREFGDPSVIGIVLHLQGLAAMALGDRPRARALMGESLEAFRRGERQRLVGLVINTIGLVAEDDGELDEALDLYRQALTNAEALGAATETAYASHDLGALTARIGRPASALPLLRAAELIWQEQGLPIPHAKTQAHLALALLAVGSSEEAAELAGAGLEKVAAGVPVGETPQDWLWALHRVLVALDRDEDADVVLAAARQEIERQSQMISDDALRRQFAEQVPLNQAILAAAEERLGRPPVIVVRLARAGAALGRPLRPGEMVEVRWTISASDDDAIAGKAERRRHRLKRLITEAADEGAAPTDDDLANALSVSRRTILRDITEIGNDAAITRRRSRSAERVAIG